MTEKKLKNFKLFTSAEAHGKQSEYIRFGMDYDMWLSNLHKAYREVPEMQFTIMSTYNILSLTSYTKFLDDVLVMKKMYSNPENRKNPLLLDIPYLRFPHHQAVFLMNKELIPMLYDQVTHMYKNLEYKNWYATANKGFFEYEADRLKRIFNLVKDGHNENEHTDYNRKNFAIFVDEHDRRRGTNFLETFPELGDFYTMCKSL